MKTYKFKKDYYQNEKVNFVISINFTLYYDWKVKQYNKAIEDEYVGILGKIYFSDSKEYKNKIKELKNEIEVLNKVISEIVNAEEKDIIDNMSDYIEEVE